MQRALINIARNKYSGQSVLQFLDTRCASPGVHAACHQTSAESGLSLVRHFNPLTTKILITGLVLRKQAFSKLSWHLRLSSSWLSRTYSSYCLPFALGPAGPLISAAAVLALPIGPGQTDATRSAEGVQMAWFLSQQWSIPVNSGQKSAPSREKEPLEAWSEHFSPAALGSGDTAI